MWNAQCINTCLARYRCVEVGCDERELGLKFMDLWVKSEVFEEAEPGQERGTDMAMDIKFEVPETNTLQVF